MLAKEGELGCKVSITIDMWTAPNNKAWLVVTGHWIDENFQLRTMVLEFREMLGRYGGREMAQVVEETIVQWGLEGRCLGFTTDNASSNIAAFRRMSEEGGGQCFFSSRMHFRCLAHVINLAVQAALAVDSIRKLLKILREMASWIGFSPQRSGSFLGLQRTLNSQANPATPKPALKLVQDSPTRWGSTHDMVERAGVLQNPITVFFAQTQGLSKTDKKKVESLRLTDAEWETLQAVKTFLSPFAKVSKAAEGAAYPTVSMVVPYYNGLIDAMESRLAKGPSPTLQQMIVAALSHLKKYAYITSNEYWIATFLDPSMKAAWFDDAHWEKLHPKTDKRVRPRPASGEVIKLVRDRVAEYQARAAELAPRPTPLAPVAEEEDGDEEEDDDDAQFLPSRRRLAARLSASQEAGAGGMVQDDELSRYLSERVRCDVTALEYWRSATNMQTLRRMARDYLAIPATSASSERVFSLGRNLISWKRHRLASQRTRAVMILRSWYSSHPGQRIGEGRRPRGVAPPEFAIEGEGAEEDDEEEEEEGVEADDTAAAEDAVVGSSSGALVGHVTKAGDVAGPRDLKHIVDVVMHVESDRQDSHRILSTSKNRFGSTDEVGVFEMAAQGMVAVPNPSLAFLPASRTRGSAAVAVVMHGSRPLLLEVQALCVKAIPNIPPTKTANGVDMYRLTILTKIMRHVGLPIGSKDVVVNVVGGMQVKEPAADLAIAVAIASSLYESPVPADMAFIGEIGLNGELRGLDRRVNEVAKLGFSRCIVPAKQWKGQAAPSGCEVVKCEGLRDALKAVGIQSTGYGGKRKAKEEEIDEDEDYF
ncbi:unnamed protein product [Closterium sp. Naga37s-1]|nr:unnamed protein product [Closterium sp. Naga37s-1]